MKNQWSSVEIAMVSLGGERKKKKEEREHEEGRKMLTRSIPAPNRPRQGRLACRLRQGRKVPPRDLDRHVGCRAGPPRALVGFSHAERPLSASATPTRPCRLRQNRGRIIPGIIQIRVIFVEFYLKNVLLKKISVINRVISVYSRSKMWTFA